MKIIHDLKNPLIALHMCIEDSKLDQDDKEELKNEIEEMHDMLDSLKTEFKTRNDMKFNETQEYHKVHDLLNSFKRAFTKLAQNGNNILQFKIQQNFPQKIMIRHTLLKRIINNLISNALKHTQNGKVDVRFTDDFDQASDKNAYKNIKFIMVGSEYNPKLKQLRIEVEDNGKGIHPDKIHKIFEELHSDQEDQNWDGIGLGLPICLKLAIQSN